jgi:hypothetical protein
VERGGTYTDPPIVPVNSLLLEYYQTMTMFLERRLRPLSKNAWKEVERARKFYASTVLLDYDYVDYLERFQEQLDQPLQIATDGKREEKQR